LTEFTDGLTGVATWRLFDEVFGRYYSLARRRRAPLSLLAFDLDFFNSVNDEYGHAAGDEVLAGFGALLMASCRKEDLAGRLGGEKLAVLLPATPLDRAVIQAERVRAAMAGTPWSRVPRAVTVSVGVTTLRGDEARTTFVERADRALYRAKRDGRNQVVAVD